MALGGVLALTGLVGMLVSGGAGESEEALATTTSVVATTTLPPTTTSPPGTTSTTLAATTTTAPLPTSATVDDSGLIRDFVALFNEAIGAADIDLLYEMLHPVVVELFDEELCRTFIQNEILLLVDYRLTGEIQGPVTQTIGGTTVEVYSGAVAFTFQGQDFDSEATFAIEDGAVRWFTECR